MTQTEKQSQALSNAISNQSTMNYTPIIQGFMGKGIPIDDIKPRENVFTFNAWKALGRSVKKGEHGVKVITFVPMSSKSENENGEQETRSWRRPWTTTVFHVSQTEERKVS